MTDKLERLEPEYAETYNAWKADPSPDNSSAMLSLMQPEIDRMVRAFPEADRNALRLHAKKLFLNALPRYSPNQAGLRTFTSRQLQGLTRASRDQTNITRIPERRFVELYNLSEAERSFQDEFGRPPSTEELADRAFMSVDKIRKIRSTSSPVNTGTFYGAVGEDGLENGDLPSSATPMAQKYKMEYVLSDLGEIDRVIAEHSFELYGRKRIPVAVLAGKLGISPATVSNRTKKLLQKFQQAEQAVFNR